MSDVAVNGRFQHLESGGFKTYATEVSARLPGAHIITPRISCASGWRGRLWEQTILPLRARNKILLSPAGSGPWFHRRHICVIHDLIPLQRPDLYSSRYVRATQLGLAMLTRRVSWLVAPSDDVREALVDHGFGRVERIAVAPPGVGAQFIKSANDSSESGSLVVGLNSNIPRKGGDRTVAALAQVQQLRPEIRTVAFGHDGPERVFNAQERPSHPDVEDQGVISDEATARIFRAADVVVTLSVAEGFGMPPLEALAAGASVVATYMPSLQSRWSRRCRRVPAEATAQDIARIIFDVLDDDVEPEAGNCELSFPSWDDTADAINQLLRQV